MKESLVYDDFLKRYKIKDVLIGEVDNLDTDDYWFPCEIIFENDGVHVIYDGNEVLFINKNKIEDIIDVGMGATQFAINVGTGKTISRYPIHIDIAKKYWGNISLKESKEICAKYNTRNLRESSSIYLIAYYTGGTDSGYVSYDGETCNSIDFAMTFDSRAEAERECRKLQKEWKGATLQVEEFEL